MKRSLLLVLFILLLCANAFSQDDKKEMVVKVSAFNTFDGKVYVYYDLDKVFKTNYAFIKLYYSFDDGATYTEIENAEGDIGQMIPIGANKKIVWIPSSESYGLIGNVVIKVVANPYYLGTTMFVNYLHYGADFNTATSELDTDNYYTAQKYMLGFGFRKGDIKRKPYFLMYGSYFNKDWNPIVGEGLQVTDGYTAGIGFISKRKFLSMWAGGGVMNFDHINNANVYDISTLNNQPCLEVGLMLRLIKPFTIPVNYLVSKDLGNYVSAGIGIMF